MAPAVMTSTPMAGMIAMSPVPTGIPPVMAAIPARIAPILTPIPAYVAPVGTAVATIRAPLVAPVALLPALGTAIVTPFAPIHPARLPASIVRGTIGTSIAAQILTATATSSVVRGKTTARGGQR